MGDHAIANASLDDGRDLSSVTIPPQVLARWAAMASERAYSSMLPRQMDTNA